MYFFIDSGLVSFMEKKKKLHIWDKTVFDSTEQVFWRVNFIPS